VHDITVTKTFDNENELWSSIPDRNIAFVMAQIMWATDLTRTRDVVTLNDVYDLFGFQRTAKGLIHGWVGEFKATFEGGYRSDNEETRNHPLVIKFEVKDIRDALEEGW
jgi:hypothetical protein